MGPSMQTEHEQMRKWAPIWMFLSMRDRRALQNTRGTKLKKLIKPCPKRSMFDNISPVVRRTVEEPPKLPPEHWINAYLSVRAACQ